MQPHARPFTLTQLKIELTYRCNLTCIHCSSDARPSNPLEMMPVDCFRILKEASSVGVRQVAFSGGEPLLWPGLPEGVTLAARLGLDVTVYTSGNVEDFHSMASQLHSAGASRLVLSVFGGTAATHEWITRKAGSFERTMTAIEAASQIGLQTEIHFVPMSGNYQELKDVAFPRPVVGCNQSQRLASRSAREGTPFTWQNSKPHPEP